MQATVNLPVLIIAFQRPENLKEIVERCIANGVRHIYISVDGPPKNSQIKIRNHNSIKSFLLDLRSNLSIQVSMRFSAHNVGCSANVLNSIDWFFSNEEFGAILEDDCIPEDSFFLFARSSLTILSENNEVKIAGGSQFYPGAERENADWMIGKYPIIWGWVTTRDNWVQLSSLMKIAINQNSHRLDFLSASEDLFWAAGLRRASLGFTDAWDAVLAYVFHKKNFKCLLPAVSLIRNVGNDDYAVHNMKDNKQIQMRTGIFINSSSTPKYIPEMDRWYRRNVYRISFRHRFSTKVTRLLDYFVPKRAIYQKLEFRWTGVESFKP